jgi:hypothetical protein
MSSAFPSLAPSIEKAKKYGYSPSKIISYLGSLFGGGEEIKGGTEAAQEKLSGQQTKEKFKQLGGLGVGVLGAYAASRAVPSLVQGARGLLGGPNTAPPGSPPTTPSPQPPIGPQPMGNAPVSPPPVPPVGPAPAGATAPVTPPANAQTAAPSQAPIAPGNPQQSATVIEQMGLGEKIKNLVSAGNPPETIAAAINVSLKPGQKKWLDDKIKSGEAQPLEQMVKDYISARPVDISKESGQYPNSGSALSAQAKLIQPLEEQKEVYPEYPGESEEEKALFHQRQEEEAQLMDKEERDRFNNIEYWDKWLREHTKNREKPLRSTKDFLLEAKAQQKIMESHWEKGHNRDEQLEMHASLQKYVDHLRELDALEERDKNVKKGDLVFDEESENFGKLKDIKKKEALIDDNGKLHKVKLENLEKTPEDLIKAAQDLLKIPEVDRSSVISLLTYRPSSNELFIQYHNGETYAYEDIDKDLVNEITEAMGTPVTSGKNIYGAWEEGKKDSRGAALIHKILRDPKYSKENEGKTWEKLGTHYDYWKKLRKVPKRKKK